jgi:hypothetical protein
MLIFKDDLHVTQQDVVNKLLTYDADLIFRVELMIELCNGLAVDQDLFIASRLIFLRFSRRKGRRVEGMVTSRVISLFMFFRFAVEGKVSTEKAAGNGQ